MWRGNLRRVGWTLWCSAIVVVSVLESPPANADVLEIADDGSVVVRAAAAQRRPVTAVRPRPRLSRPPAALWPIFERAAAEQSLAAELIEAVAWTESRFQPRAVSPVGAIGLMQLMPGTARDLGVEARDPQDNVHGGTAYLRQLLDRYEGNVVKALAAYNAGPGAVDRYGGVPPYAETRAYVARILARLAATTAVTQQEPRQ